MYVAPYTRHFLLIERCALLTEEVLSSVASIIDDNLLKEDVGVKGTQGECMRVVRCGCRLPAIDVQRNHGVDDAASYGRISDAVDVLRCLVEVAIEIDHLRFTIVHRDGEAMALMANGGQC